MKGSVAPWSPDFSAKPLSPEMAGSAVWDLTAVADCFIDQLITLCILNGAHNMPSFASSLEPQELTAIVAFLDSRNPAARADNPKE